MASTVLRGYHDPGGDRAVDQHLFRRIARRGTRQAERLRQRTAHQRIAQRRLIVRPLADPGWFAELGWTEGRSLLLVFDEAPARALRRTLLSFAQAFPTAEAAFAFVRPGLLGRAASRLLPALSSMLPVAGALGAARWHRDLVALDEVDCLGAIAGPLGWLGALHRALTGEPLVGVARLGVGWASRRGAATPLDPSQPRQPRSLSP